MAGRLRHHARQPGSPVRRAPIAGVRRGRASLDLISGALRRDTGHPPPVIDTLLAATALEHDLYLATRNVRDVRHSGAAVFNLWEDDAAAFPVLRKRRRRASET